MNRAFLLPLILAAAPCLPAAKCPMVTYQLRGVVLAGSGRVVPNARVNISWDASRRQAVTTSDGDGRYHVTVRFNSFASEDQFGVVCNRALQAVTVAVLAEDGQTATRTLDAEQLRNELKLVVSMDPGAGRPGASAKRRARWMKW
jgi:hypothetical protein